ncbi:LCP family protein [Cumulibacter manganitolerans]|uniref:LCP family protein n=1 Tax=Cumulibacter manganitolerans TaxID=1884992 RepID=UPI0012975B73|nr:LCP family protein [Cumulibacter manganitolerans]
MAKHHDDDEDALRLEDLAGDDSDSYRADSAPAGRRKNFFGRHKVLTAFLVLLGLLVGSVVGFAVYLNSKLSDVDTYVSKIDEKDRVPKVDVPAGQKAPINILLLGADKASGKSIAELIAAGKWAPGSMRSDTMMLVHIPADRSRVYLMSFPRDSWVNIPGRQGKDKINAAFSYGGPDLALKTIEQYSQVHIDHVMMIDWNGFKDLTDALGGVTINEPGVGTHKMNGEQALAYVRTRYTLPNGDFDRVKRQQNFLRAIMAQTVDSISVTDPLMLSGVLGAVANNTTVDADFTPSVMRDLAWEMRGIKTQNVSFFTVPTKGTGMEGAASVVYLDDARCKELFTAVNNGLLPQYMNSHKVDSLPDPSNVN